jgi:hypothetical protein
MPHSLLIAACLAIPSNLAAAGLDGEVDKPYQFRVIVLIAKNPVFTPAFKDRVKRGLQGALQGDLGDSAEVEVVDRAALEAERKSTENGQAKARLGSLDRALELIRKVEDEGLQQAIDNWKEVSEIKTHIVLLAFVDGIYTLRARQFDGISGLPSPLVRESQTNDRELVVREAALLIDRDFGLVGTVRASARKSTEVEILLKAGSLGPLNTRIQKGDVFALSQIKQGSAGPRSFRVPEALLQVVEEPQKTVCRCRLWHRYEDPLASGPAVLGYRCLMLSTTEARLHVRLVDGKDRPRGGLRVTISADEQGTSNVFQGATDADGFVGTAEPYRNMAFVRVLNEAGAAISAPIPVEILGERPQVCRILASEKAEKTGQYEFDRRFLIGRLNESLVAMSVVVAELNQARRSPQARQEALAKTRAALKELETDLTTYREEMARLNRLARGIDLGPVKERVQALQKKQRDFQRYISEIEEVVRDETDPARARLRQMAENAQLLEHDAQFDQAIALYEEIVKEARNVPKFQAYRDRLEQLKKAWTPKNEEHRQARAFLYDTWPKLETAAQVKARLGEANQAFQVCKGAGDRLTPLMLLKANTVHATRLAKRLEGILSSTNVDDQNEGKIIVEVQEGLEKLTNEAADFLRPKNGGTP